MPWSAFDKTYCTATEVLDRLPCGGYTASIRGGRVYFTEVDDKDEEIYIFKNSPTEAVLQELDNFWDGFGDYQKAGIPHKRGILLYGDPGDGKTSILRIVANVIINKGGYVLYKMDPYLEDLVEGIKTLRKEQPDSPILVVFEDIDSLIEEDETGLLQLLDGVYGFENIVYIATTNYMGDVPARVAKRPSRFDTLIQVGPPDENLRYKYLISVGENSLTSNKAKLWAKKTEGLSFACLKELFISVHILKRDLNSTIERLRSLSDEEE